MPKSEKPTNTLVLDLPRQPNPDDCGIYLLHYVEKLLEDPSPFANQVIPNLSNWFTHDDLQGKRKAIQEIIKKLPKAEKRSGLESVLKSTTDKKTEYESITSSILQKPNELSNAKVQPKDLKCEQCGKTFSNRSNLINHLRHMHMKSSASFICQACDKYLTTKQNLIEHLRRVHLKQTGEQCEFCPKILSDKSNLATHIKRIHLKSAKMKCNICSDIMSSQQSVAVHIKKAHCKLISLKCEQCPKTFTIKSNLKQHNISKH